MRRFIEYEGQSWTINRLAVQHGIAGTTLRNRIARFGATTTGISRSLTTGLLDHRQAGMRGAANSPWREWR